MTCENRGRYIINCMAQKFSGHESLLQPERTVSIQVTPEQTPVLRFYVSEVCAYSYWSPVKIDASNSHGTLKKCDTMKTASFLTYISSFFIVYIQRRVSYRHRQRTLPVPVHVKVHDDSFSRSCCAKSLDDDYGRTVWANTRAKMEQFIPFQWATRTNWHTSLCYSW